MRSCLAHRLLRSLGMDRSAVLAAVLFACAQPAQATGPDDGATCSPPGRGPLADLLDALGEVRTLLTGHVDRDGEARILYLFRTASAADLDGLFGALPVQELHRLIDEMNDRWIGPDNRTAFFTLLRARLPGLSIASRAKLITALQHQDTDLEDERLIRDVFLATHGSDLTALKKAIDHGGDHRDLQQLLHHDIDDPGVFDAILAHFAREARVSPPAMKVYSDIDDTFYASHRDGRYPRRTVYPGVRAFYAALDGGPDGDEPGDLLFLSARPYDRGGAVERDTRAMLEGSGVSDPTILSGDLLHLLGNESIADKKYSNWRELNALYPEAASVFVGDSGQGDAIFGARAMATPGGAMKRVFIHDVIGLDAGRRAALEARGVHVFDTYVGAATDAYRHGLISREGLLDVADSARRELAGIPFSSSVQRAAREAELARDLAVMHAALDR